MADGFGDLIRTLERHKSALEKAIAALREIDGTAPDWVTGSTVTTKPEVSPRRGRKRTASQRRRMAEGQRERYRRIRAEAEPAPMKKATAKTKRKISPEGLKNIIAAQKKRWTAAKKR